MFHAQKEYVFRAMEQEAFPRFLRAKAFGNLTPASALVRLVAGMICLWAGLATAFALVFLDVKPKSVRFFVSPPFFPSLLAGMELTRYDTTAVHPIHTRHPPPHLTPIRTRPNPRVLQTERKHAVPHVTHPGTVRRQTVARTRSLGDACRGAYYRRADDVVLGGSGASVVSVFPALYMSYCWVAVPYNPPPVLHTCASASRTYPHACVLSYRPAVAAAVVVKPAFLLSFRHPTRSFGYGSHYSRLGPPFRSKPRVDSAIRNSVSNVYVGRWE